MRKLASVRRVREIQPIPGADRIVLAVVDGWKCVVKKDEFQVGDLAVYCEIDSFLPVKEEFEFLRKSSFKKMGETEGFRLRTVKLRGQISQGLLLPISIVDREVELGHDVTEELGIQKYEAPIPTCLTGEVIGGMPSKIEKTDEERIQNLTEAYHSFRELEFFVSEKIDGTSFTAFWDNGRVGVCGRNWQYAETESNSYWQIANKLDLPKKLNDLGRKIAIQGELIGPGIQKNRYRLKEANLLVFNIFDIEAGGYVPKSELEIVCEKLKLELVPFMGIRKIPGSIDDILIDAQGKSVLQSDVEREGLVWVHGSGDSRVSFKAISNKFLEKE